MTNREIAKELEKLEAQCQDVPLEVILAAVQAAIHAGQTFQLSQHVVVYLRKMDIQDPLRN